MPAPRWFFRFMYDRESAALERLHDQPDHREVDECTDVDQLCALAKFDLELLDGRHRRISRHLVGE